MWYFFCSVIFDFIKIHKLPGEIFAGQFVFAAFGRLSLFVWVV
jgi:hypothetical protein